MVQRSFFAIDNESLVVTSSANGGLVGNPIINNSATPTGTRFVYSAGEGREITVDDTAGSPDILEDDLPNGHRIIDGNGLVADGSRIEAESFHFVREVAPDGSLTGPTIRVTVFSQNGQTSNIWGLASDQPLLDGATYQKISGSNRGSARYETFVPCFGPGTRVLTPSGELPVEDLGTGDAVWTRDNGAQTLRWVGRTSVRGTGRLAPVVIGAGALGNDRDLIVSQQHRMLVTGAAAELAFGEPEVLVAAKHLVGLTGISLGAMETVTYTHLMCDRHEILLANGCYSESFFLGDTAISALDDDARTELLSLFPSLDAGMSTFGPMVAPALRAGEAAVLRAALG